MKLALHWRFALWNSIIVVLAFVFFGTETRSVFFVLLSGAIVLGLVLFLRSGISKPLAQLSREAGEIKTDKMHSSKPVNGLSEVRQLGLSIDEMKLSVASRISKLSESSSRLQSILGSMTEGVMVFGPGNRIILANQSVKVLFGIQHDPVDKSCLEVFRNEELEIAVRATISNKGPKEFDLATNTGLTIHVHLTYVPGPDLNKEGSVVAVFRDISESKKKETIRRDFVTNVSHEFKTPLTSIRGAAETLITELKEAESHQIDFLYMIQRNAHQLESLVNDLIELAKIEGELPSNRTEVDIRSVIEEQLSLKQTLIDGGGISLATNCPDFRVRTDLNRLRVAISNLLDNAIRYNRKGGEIRINGEAKGDFFILDIIDSGFGIPEEELGRIFERFYQVDKARTKVPGSTGLGLAIAKHAIESQGGQLKVTSKVGEGATFSIWYPIGRETG